MPIIVHTDTYCLYNPETKYVILSWDIHAWGKWKVIDPRVGLGIFDTGDIQAGVGEETFTNRNNGENLYLQDDGDNNLTMVN